MNAVLPGRVQACDAGTVTVQVPEEYQHRLVELIALIDDVTLTPDSPAKIVINERTGTVVIGGKVTVLPVALAHGNLTVTINPTLIASQPAPLSNGETVRLKTAQISVKEPTVSLTQIPGGTVEISCIR